jgi:formylglycine-generating enzyme required for sulfatase activity
MGRFRKSVEAGKGIMTSPPADGSGANPNLPGSGWQSAWNASLAANTSALTSAVKCFTGYETWTDSTGSNENRPINCTTWYEAFAFCIWDGGRLPTEAEWNYAAAGGSEQRAYPWSSAYPPGSTTIDSSYAVYNTSSAANVGSKSPKGDSKWGQADMAGNVWERVLDWYASYPNPCNNCANLTVASNRVFRGGSFGLSASSLLSSIRIADIPSSRGFYMGSRCARTP